jgi:hypothetical protein
VFLSAPKNPIVAAKVAFVFLAPKVLPAALLFTHKFAEAVVSPINTAPLNVALVPLKGLNKLIELAIKDQGVFAEPAVFCAIILAPIDGLK